MSSGDFGSGMSDVKDEAGKMSSDFDNLKQSFNQLRTDVMTLMRDALGVGKTGASSLGGSAQAAVGSAVSGLKERANRLRDLGADQMHSVEQKIEDNPMTSALIAFGVGFVLAKLLTRR
jgi:ElaB/YqjD/DUF883 family membrane-anchored ribosome-binding protein